jgi:hypothetical protein
MSILKSYFSKNNTLEYNSYTNTGRNPVTQLYFGGDLATYAPRGFTRFIFDLDLTYLEEQIASGIISTGCTSGMTHVLNMTNTSSFDIELLNGTTSDGSRRATSFDLILLLKIGMKVSVLITYFNQRLLNTQITKLLVLVHQIGFKAQH